jgi:DNA-binding MarR family transcriptional regulator
MRVSAGECARQVLETVPLVMAAIRTEIRSQRGSELSVPQFRVLIFLNRHAGASLSDIAEHLGLTLPSMSKMIDGLLARNMVTRQMHAEDRRRLTLTLTALGRQTMQSASEATESRLAERLVVLPPAERRIIIEAMQVLESIFRSSREAKTTHGK